MLPAVHTSQSVVVCEQISGAPPHFLTLAVMLLLSSCETAHFGQCKTRAFR